MRTLYPPPGPINGFRITPNSGHIIPAIFFISNTLSWNKKSQNNRLFRDLYVWVFFTSCGGLRGLHSFLSAQWPSTLSLTTLTLTQTRSEGVEASCCAADRREAYLWPGAQSAQRRRCLLLLRGNGMSLTWNHKCDLWNADAVITCVVAVFLSVLLGKDYWNNMTAVVFCLFFSLFHRHTCSLMGRMRSWGKE